MGLGVFEKVQESEWGMPAFPIPKKDNTIRFVFDARVLNAKIKRKPYPIPKTQDLLQRLGGFTYASSLDLNMGYWHIELNEKSSEHYKIVLPYTFGKHRYKRLPMGVASSPDIFQEKKQTLMEGLENVRTYLDDILVITKGSFQDHLNELEQVLIRLHAAGLKVNLPKSKIGVKEVEYLRYIITQHGVRPISKKLRLCFE